MPKKTGICLIQYDLYYFSGADSFIFMFLMSTIDLHYSVHFEYNRFSDVQMVPDILTQPFKLEEQI